MALGDDVVTPVGYGGSKTTGGGERKMKLRTQIMILALCAVSVVAMAGITAASNVNNADDGAREIGSTYSFSMGPGGSYTQSSSLDAGAPADYDVWVMTVTEGCTVTVEVVDCCIMGDTMVLKAGKKLLYATSPDTIVGTATLGPGTYTFYTGYADCTGGYPAGYHIEVQAT